MKLTRRQLRKLITEISVSVNEKKEPKEYKVKTVSPDQYSANVASLPPTMQDFAAGPEPTETPRHRHTVGNFFMTKGVPYNPPRGYSGLKKMFDFYMILPDGEAILVNPSNFIITNSKEAMRFLNLLNQNITPISLDSLENAVKLQNQVRNVISMMRQK